LGKDNPQRDGEIEQDGKKGVRKYEMRPCHGGPFREQIPTRMNERSTHHQQQSGPGHEGFQQQIAKEKLYAPFKGEASQSRRFQRPMTNKRQCWTIQTSRYDIWHVF
jgi:hypothetical protein